jgi:hypothetical protein
MVLHILLVEDPALSQVSFGVITHLFVGIEFMREGGQEGQEIIAVLLLDEALNFVALMIAHDIRRFRFCTRHSLWILMADFAFRKPIVCATLYSGGILKHRWMWSGVA